VLGGRLVGADAFGDELDVGFDAGGDAGIESLLEKAVDVGEIAGEGQGGVAAGRDP
jgi:hypothetical protein